MDSPPPLPEKRPLGRTFFILFFAPIIVMAISAGVGLTAERNSNLQGLGVALWAFDHHALLVCSIICAMMVGQRRNPGLGVLTFFGIQVIYIAVAFGGCIANLQKMDFR
jgi:hypothetical membrane protein